jgi:multidrug efflux system outer membrane protein
MKTPRSLAPAALLLALGCAVGPDYEEPQTKAGDAFAGSAQAGISADPVIVAWWRQFEDPVLNRLIDRAIWGSRDVQTATALLREARALYDQQTYDFAPTITAGGGYNRQLLSKEVAPGATRDDRTFGYWNAGFDAFWEVDLFGRIRRANEAAWSQTGAFEATRRDVLVTLLAEVARNYFEYRGSLLQLAVARRNAQNQEESLKFVTARFEGGRATELDVSRAKAELQSTRALIPPIEEDVHRSKNRLAVLLGEQPSAFTLALSDPTAAFDKLPSMIAVGRPEELLRRRPDIRQAERTLASSTAGIGVATADLYPRLTFSGTFGPQAQTISGLFQAGSAAYSFGPSLTWAFLDLGRVKARIKASGAHAEADLHRFEQTVLLALEETENALVSVGRTRERRDALILAVQASERAAELAEARYQAGAVDYLASLDAQRQVLSFQLQLVGVRTRTVTSIIALYKALGGGWEYAPEGGALQLLKE